MNYQQAQLTLLPARKLSLFVPEAFILGMLGKKARGSGDKGFGGKQIRVPMK